MIRKIFTEKNFEHQYLSDVLRIQRVLLENGYEADLPDCAKLWDDYSDSMAAGWLFLPDTDYELWYILRWIVEEDSH